MCTLTRWILHCTPCVSQALEEQGEEMEAAQASAVASAAASEDLHASLEAQLRAWQADCGRLQSETARLKSAAASAAASGPQSPRVSPTYSSSQQAKLQASLEQQLQRSQTEAAALQEEVASLKAAAAADHRPVSTSGRNSESALSSQAEANDLPGVAPQDLQHGLASAELQRKLQATEMERDKAKQQLSR